MSVVAPISKAVEDVSRDEHVNDARSDDEALTGPRAVRLMRAEGNVPVLGETASTLGVRVPKDIAPDGEGLVTPDGKHGLSVRPTLDAYLEDACAFVPRRYRDKDAIKFRNATGNNNVKTFRLGDARFTRAQVSELLVLAPDRVDHGVIEPAKKMSLETYKGAIAATQPDWEIDEP